MHGRESGFSHILITEADSMGGVVDFGVGLDTKTSPSHAAIAKAQEQLRLEYDAREDRRRELEFLEKGGNPLDFKLGRASISLQSTSFTDQLVEHEAKGSFVVSPHGDSAESSGHPGISGGREANIADNLLLFGRGKFNLAGEKNTKRTGRRMSAIQLEKSSQIAAQRNSKDSGGSLVFRLGAKGQAYARRNRSRSNRDSQINKYASLASSSADLRDVTGSLDGVLAEEHAVSSISNSKSDAQAKNLPKNPASEMEIDGEKTEYIGTENERGGTYGTEARSSENLQVNECDAASVEQTAGIDPTQPSQLIGNTSHSGHDVRANGCNAIGADITGLHVYDMNGRKHVSDALSEMVGEKNTDMVPAQIRTICPRIAVHDDSFALKTGVCLEKGPKEQPTDGGPLNASIATEGLQFAGSVHSVNIDKSISLPRNFSNSVVLVKEEKVLLSRNDANGEEKSLSNVGRMKDRKSENSVNITGVVSSNSLCPTDEPFSTVVKMVSSTVPERQSGETSQVNYTKKANEDAILRDARIIEANLKRAVAPSKKCLSTGKWHKCQWDFVLEEMAWMANDFMQERMWKTAAAVHVSQLIASFGRSKFEEEHICRKLKNTARTLAKAVMQFWHSAKAIHSIGETNSGMVKDCAADLCDLSNTNNLDIMSDQGDENCQGYLPPGIQSYALRFLHFMSAMSHDPVLAEAPCTPKRIDGSVILEVSGDDELSGECLFYEVRPGAMQSYRESIESQWADYKRMGNVVYREEYEASMCGSVADRSRESVFEDEAETETGILPGAFENNFSFKITSKKKKLQQKACTQRLYGVGPNLYDPYPDGKSADHSAPIVGKRPSSTLNVGTAPTKRTRTAARQRTVNCFGTGVTGSLQRTSRTDVSSGDTSSFQDDQCSLHGGSQPWNHLEVESTADFERRLPFDGIQMPRKSKKRRKSKHLWCKSSLNLSDSGALILPGKATSYEQRLQADSVMRQDQRDLMKMRFESRSFEPNENPGFYGQHVAKKTKFMKHTDSHEQIALSGGPMPSPVASQMSNMSNSNKLIRIINGRDRGRKSKAMKVAAGYSGSGNSWSSFEDQALVVLVHDMGINWELVSDALNSALLFKCVYRKPKDCKERHKFLMDRSTGDGADSAEDSGSSQPYQSTLPGIPKGSARQLFQRLHGPMEEDTLKARFEKIILIGQRMSTCRSQSDIYDPKHTPAHNSHAFTLSQAHPNNLSGTILSPLDLCDAVNTGSDVANLGYQGSHSNSITVSGHQGSLLPVHPTSTSSIMLQGSPSMVLGNGLPSPSPSVNTPPRDTQRYAVPRSTALLVDDQQRMQNYNQIFPGRNMQQPGISVLASSGGADRVHMLHGSNGMGVVCGVNRSLPMQRPSFQGISPTGILNMVPTNSMTSSNNVGMPNSIGAHSSVISCPGHTMLRPRDALQMVQPGQSTEEQKQVMMQELQLQASQGNAHSVTQFSGMNSPFSNAATSPVQTFPGQPHHPHQITQMLGNPHPSQLQGSNHSSTPHQAYIRFAKERQLQQKAMLPAQHPNSASTAASPMQNNINPQHQKQLNSTNSLSSSYNQQISTRNAQSNGAMTAQIIKQRQRLQVEQPRSVQLQPQPQPQAKHLKCVGRGSTLINPNVASDGSHFAGLQAAPKNQTCEKLAMQQNQGLFSCNAGLNPNMQHKNQHKLYSRPQSQSSKHVTVVSSAPHNNQSSIEAPPVHSIATSQQSVTSSSNALAAHPQQLQLRQANQSPPKMQRMAPQQNPILKPDGQIQSSSEHVPQSSDSVSSPTLLPTGTQWKQDTLLERNISAPTTLLVGPSQENISGNSAVKVPPRQFSANLPTHGHGAGGQWLQQQQLLSSQSHPSPPQQQNQQGVQGNLYTRPLNAGLG